jgi:hypothetical protein
MSPRIPVPALLIKQLTPSGTLALEQYLNERDAAREAVLQQNLRDPNSPLAREISRAAQQSSRMPAARSAGGSA